MNTRKFLFLLSALVSFTCSFGQVYMPATHTVSNKSYGVAQASPTDARTYFYDANNFVYRPYQSTAEVLSYLTLAKYRTGQFDIIVNTGGTINGDGTLTGGTNAVWYFRDGVADVNLVLKITGTPPTYAGENGITFDGTTFRQGGTGTANTTIAWGAFSLTNTFNSIVNNGFSVSSTSTAIAANSKLVSVTASGATGAGINYGLWVQNSRTGSSPIAIYGEGGSFGLYGVSSSGGGVFGTSTSGAGGSFSSTSSFGISGTSGSGTALSVGSATGFAAQTQQTALASANTIATHVWSFLSSAGTPAAGFGGRYLFGLKSTTTTAMDAAAMDFWWTDPTHATRSAAWGISVVNNGGALTRRLQVLGNGELTLSGYGAGTHTGTITKWAAFTSAGLLVETDPPASLPWGGTFFGTANINLATWTISQDNTFQIYTGAVPSTWTLPNRATSTKTIWIKNNGSADVTVQRAGADQIWTSSAVNSVTLSPGQSRGFYNLGGYWTSYFDASGSGGSLDAVPTDASVNGVESNGVFDALAGKQATLNSGSNIKTINSTSIVGAGNIDVAPLSHTHAQADVTNLVGDLAALAPDAALANGDASPIQNNAVFDEFQLAYADIATRALKTNNLSDLASPATALTNLGGTPLNRAITMFGAEVATQDFASDRTFYTKSHFQSAIEALGSTIKGQAVGIEMNGISGVPFTAADGTVYWTALWLPSPETLTGIKFWLAASGTFVGDNFNGFALYTYNGSGTLTQVATSANDEGIWEGTGNAFTSVAFTTPYVAAAGLYYVAFVRNSLSETVAPTFGIGGSVQNGAMNAGDFTNSAKLVATHTSQTTLPASRLMSSITVTTLRPWVGVY